MLQAFIKQFYAGTPFIPAELMMQEEVFTNVAKCVELNKEKTAVNEELEQLYEHWEELAE